MDLKCIAMDAIASSGNENAAADFPGTITQNPDGTVTYSVLVQFDPEVQKEMAKAMPKGVKRDDLADDLGEQGGKEEAGTDEDEAEFVEGEVGVAEDASPSRHSQTPLENCRAKDPMFCPYHGDKAIKKAIEDELSSSGVSAYTVTVSPKEKGGYSISVVTPTPTPAAAVAIQHAFSDSQGNTKKGIKIVAGQNTTPQDIGVEIDNSSASDRDVSMLDEWLDDLMLDIDADQTLLQELDPNDMAALLDAMNTLGTTPKQVNGQDNPAYGQALKDAQDKYHALRAQIDFRKVKNLSDAQAQESRLDGIYNQLGNDYHAAATPTRDAKKAIFPGGKFPRGFKAAHPWADKLGMADMNVFFAQRDYAHADNELQQAFAAGDVKDMRTALGKMQNTRDRYEMAVEAYKDTVPEFMKEFEDWAMNDSSITPAQLQQAFPNSQSKASAPTAPASPSAPAQPAQQQASSGRVSLPQSWGNFVMGANKVLPTDQIRDLPYGNENGFHNAYMSAFPYRKVSDIIESFDISPASGDVKFVMSPKVSSNDAQAFANNLRIYGYANALQSAHKQPSGSISEVIYIPFNATLAAK